MTLLNRLLTLARGQNREVKRFIKFLFVGTFGFIVDFMIFTLAFRVLGIPEVIAQACSFTVAVISNFLWNYFWIYPDSRAGHVATKIVKFIVVSVASLFIRTPIFALVLGVADKTLTSMKVAEAMRNSLKGYVALAVSVIIVMIWNFVVNRLWTYRDVE
jgi:putative flippase GtrA